MKVHLIHGIRSQGQCTVDDLLPYLSQWEVAYPDYGYIVELETPFVNQIIVGTLLPYIGQDDVLIGHSNGCALIYEAMQKLQKVGGAVFINAALERGITRPPSWPGIDVYFNSGDKVTEAAAIGAQLGIVDRDWGEMGHVGYSGNDPLIVNIDCGEQRNMPVVSGHSDLFSPQNITSWGPFIASRINEHITKAS